MYLGGWEGLYLPQSMESGGSTILRKLRGGELKIESLKICFSKYLIKNQVNLSVNYFLFV